MCFTIDENQKTHLLKKFRKNNGVLYFWKIIRLNNTSPYYRQKYSYGWNRPNKFLSPLSNSEIEALHGIYVYTTQKAAKINLEFYSLCKIVKVKCFEKDLLCVGEHCKGESDTFVATFRKIFIKKADLD